VHRLRGRLRGSKAALGGVLASRDLRRVQLAWLGSETGGWVAVVALSVVSFGDGGLTGVGLVLGARLLAPAVAAPFMGVLADRFPRRRVMIAADLVRLVLVTVAAGVLWADGPLLLVYAISSLVAVASTAFRPAQAALLPSLARTPEQLTAANAVSSTIESVTAFAGPALGGVIVASADPAAAFALTAASFLWSALLLLGVEEPARAAAEQGDSEGAHGVFAQVGTGARTLVADRRVGLLVALMGAQVLVSGAFLVLVNGVAFEILEGGERQLGALLSALGIGGVIGAAVSLGLVGSRLVPSFAVGVVLWGAPIALLAVWRSPSGAFALVLVIGLANTLVDVAGYTLLQRATPDEVLARVFGIFESVMYGSLVVGALAAPALVSLVGLDASLFVTGLFLPALAALAWPSLRRLDVAAAPSADRLQLVQRVPFLRLVPTAPLEHLAGSLSPVSVPAGETVFREGDRGDRFYIVSDGEVAVAADGREIHRGGPGYYFGEIALLRDEPRMATVTASKDSSLLALDRDEFVGAVTGHAESARAADAVVASRLRASRPGLLEL
jgi:MFS family permease